MENNEKWVVRLRMVETDGCLMAFGEDDNLTKEESEELAKELRASKPYSNVWYYQVERFCSIGYTCIEEFNSEDKSYSCARCGRKF